MSRQRCPCKMDRPRWFPMGFSHLDLPAAANLPNQALLLLVCLGFNRFSANLPTTWQKSSELSIVTIVGWKGELKDRSARHVRRRPQPALVGGDDRTADGEPHTHAIWLRGVEGLEQPVDIRSEERRVGKECRSRWSPYH